MLTENDLTAVIFIEFHKRLIEGVEGPIFPILDGHPVHRSVKVRKHVESSEGKLELYSLPGCFPELKPDENVWSYVKHHTMGKMAITGPDQCKKLALGALRRSQKLPHIVRNIYLAESLRYACSHTIARLSNRSSLEAVWWNFAAWIR
jgi:transposase